MHCPKCGQQQVSEETRFCSRCGLLLTGVAQVVSNNGLLPELRVGVSGNRGSKRRRGLKLGLFIFLLSFLVVPILTVIAEGVGAGPEIIVITAVLLTMGGLLRMVYALMFEEGAPETGRGQAPPVFEAPEQRGALPPNQSVPASAFTSPASGTWRDTNDLQHQPSSVTDSTTKLLEREDDRQ